MKRNHIRLGPVVVRIGSKNLAKWGYPRVKVGGLSLWSWTNTGQFVPAGYHPRNSITWLWSVWIGRNRSTYRLRRWRHDRNTEWLIGPLRISIHRQERMPRRKEDAHV